MRIFVLRARQGPTAPKAVRRALSYPDHFEVIAQSLINALLISRFTRHDTVFHVVLEGSPQPPLCVTFYGKHMESFGGFDEEAIVRLFETVLTKSKGMERGEHREAAKGIVLRKISFEALVRELCDAMPVYLLDKKGADLRKTPFDEEVAFLFTDHIPMQKKTLSLLKRLGDKGISLSPKMLFASQCITIVHQELDYREQTGNPI